MKKLKPRELKCQVIQLVSGRTASKGIVSTGRLGLSQYLTVARGAVRWHGEDCLCACAECSHAGLRLSTGGSGHRLEVGAERGKGELVLTGES